MEAENGTDNTKPEMTETYLRFILVNVFGSRSDEIAMFDKIADKAHMYDKSQKEET